MACPADVVAPPVAARPDAVAEVGMVAGPFVVRCGLLLLGGPALSRPAVDRTGDDDVAPGDTGTHLDGLVAGLRCRLGRQLVAHEALGRVEVEPSGGALRNADLEVAAGAFEANRALLDLANAD